MEVKRKRGRPSVKKQLDIEALHQAALRSFARNGFDGFRLSSLAQELGIANSLLNYYFESKEDLWKKTLRYGFQAMEEKFTEVFRNFKDLDGIPLLKVLVRQFVYFVAEFPEYFEVFNREMSVDSNRSKWIIENLLLPFQEKVDQLYQKEQDNGQIKKVPIPNLSFINLGAAQMFFVHRYFIQTKYGIDPFDKDQIEQHADTVVEVIFNGIIDNK